MTTLPGYKGTTHETTGNYIRTDSFCSDYHDILKIFTSHTDKYNKYTDITPKREIFVMPEFTKWLFEN